jgi:hypothetical protein
MEENQRSIIVVIFTFLHALRLSGFMNVEVACDYTLIIYIFVQKGQRCTLDRSLYHHIITIANLKWKQR